MKYRLNKLLALFIALCLSSCLFSVCITASSDNGITASSTNLAPGSIFALSVVIPEAADADNASIQVNFDSTAFEVVNWKPEIPNGVYNSGSDFFTVAAASSSRAASSNNIASESFLNYLQAEKVFALTYYSKRKSHVRSFSAYST